MGAGQFAVCMNLNAKGSGASLHDLHLAQPHGVQGGLVALGRDAGAAAGNDLHRRFRQCGLEQQRVADDADAGADTAQRYAVGLLAAAPVGQRRRAESRLVEHRGAVRPGAQRAGDLPAVGAFQAVGHRQVFALLGAQIAGAVGVAGKGHRAVPAFDQLDHVGQDGLGLPGAQRAGDKVVLHVHNDQQVFHGGLLGGVRQKRAG